MYCYSENQGRDPENSAGNNFILRILQMNGTFPSTYARACLLNQIHNSTKGSWPANDIVLEGLWSSYSLLSSQRCLVNVLVTTQFWSIKLHNTPEVHYENWSKFVSFIDLKHHYAGLWSNTHNKKLHFIINNQKGVNDIARKIVSRVQISSITEKKNPFNYNLVFLNQKGPSLKWIKQLLPPKSSTGHRKKYVSVYIFN